VDLQGCRRPGFYELQRFYRFVAAWSPELAATHAVTDLTLGYTPHQRLLDFLGWPSLLAPVAVRQAAGEEAYGMEPFDAEPTLADVSVGGQGWMGGVEAVTLQTVPAEASAWRKYKEAGLTFARLNLAYDMLELTNPNRAPGEGWVVIPCVGTLETAAIDWCLAHLQAGGGLLFAPCLPLRDEDGDPDLRLSEALGVTLTDQVRPAGGELLDYGARPLTLTGCGGCNQPSVAVNGWIWRFAAPQGEVLAEYEGQPVIVQVEAGPGRAIVAGTDLTFTSPSSLEMWRSVLTGAMEIVPAVHSEGEWCHALLQRGPRGDFLTVSNEGGNVGTFGLRVGDLHLEVDLEPHEARVLALGATLGGRRLIYTTSELIPPDPDRKRVELWGKAGTSGELCFAEPVKAVLNGFEVSTEETPQGHVLRYTHGREPLLLEL
jgi:hypothetical protein